MRFVPALPWSELARLGRTGFGKVVIVAVSVVPLVYGGLLTWANADPTGRLDQVAAAVVNADLPVGITRPDGTPQTVDLGRTLAGELVSSTDSRNFDWVLTDARAAQRGLTDGTYAAVLTIPEDFSAAATSPAGDDPAAARQARLRVQSNDATNFVIGQVTRTIANTVTQSLSASVGTSYLKNVYLGLSSLGGSLSQAADGAAQLAGGAGDLRAGAVRVDDGSGELVVGLGSLASGAASLAEGTARVATGAGDLSGGLDTLASSTTPLPEQAATLDAGARRLAAGARDAANGGTALAAGLAAVADSTSALPDQAGALDAGARDVLAGARNLAAGSGALRAGAADLQQGVGQYTDAVDGLATACPAPGTPGDPLATRLCEGLAGLAGGSDALRQGAAGLASGAADVAGGLSGTTASTGLVDGLTRLRAGTQTLAVAAPRLSQAVRGASAGGKQLSSGLVALATGADNLAAGTGTLATQAPALVAGIGRAAGGAATLAAGAGQAAVGASTLADAAATATTGASDLAAGTARLAEGTNTLVDGADRLATELRSGADAVPRYTDEEAGTLGAVAAAPVGLDTERVNAVPAYGYGLAPYFLALALWVGGMASFLVLRALPDRAIASTAPSWRVALAGYGPGAALATVQAVLVALVVRYAIGIEVADLGRLIALLVLVALAFTAINQALVASLGTAGRFVALVLVGVQVSSAGGSYPVETAPAIFRTLNPWLPLTYAVRALRAIIAGGSYGVGQATLVLGGVLVLALALTVLAARRRQRWTVERLHPALAL